MQQQTQNRRWNKSNHQIQRQPLHLGIPIQVNRHIEQAFAINPDHCQNRAQLNKNLERLGSWAGKIEKIAYNNQMTSARDG